MSFERDFDLTLLRYPKYPDTFSVISVRSVAWLSMLKITDPMGLIPSHPRFLKSVLSTLIVDPRDWPFLKLILTIAFTVFPAAILLYVTNFNTGFGVAYLVWVMGYLFAPAILMLHNTSHRALFQKRFSFLRHLIPWVITPFFGNSPETYFAHHVGMHHNEGNLSKDLSSTLHYKRDSFLGFLHYLMTFCLIGFPLLLTYFRRTKRKKFFKKVLLGELSFYGLVVVLFYVNPRATLFVFIYPFLLARFGMMLGNWAQHSFVDLSDPGNSYRNSITCINTSYNKRGFNDGYHIGHHVRPTRHWTEMPADFLENRERYAREKAIVFEGIDYFGVWFFLMLKRYDWLANRFVQLGDVKMTQSEVIALLQSRTAKAN